MREPTVEIILLLLVVVVVVGIVGSPMVAANGRSRTNANP